MPRHVLVERDRLAALALGAGLSQRREVFVGDGLVVLRCHEQREQHRVRELLQRLADVGQPVLRDRIKQRVQVVACQHGAPPASRA